MSGWCKSHITTPPTRCKVRSHRVPLAHHKHTPQARRSPAGTARDKILLVADVADVAGPCCTFGTSSQPSCPSSSLHPRLNLGRSTVGGGGLKITRKSPAEILTPKPCNSGLNPKLKLKVRSIGRQSSVLTPEKQVAKVLRKRPRNRDSLFGWFIGLTV